VIDSILYDPERHGPLLTPNELQAICGGNIRSSAACSAWPTIGVLVVARRSSSKTGVRCATRRA
jgi:hypothetical protein